MRTLLLLIGLALPLAGAQARLNVVATTPDLASIASAVGGDQIQLTTLARPNEDPHFVEAKPGFIVKLNKADVLVHGGAELESGWLTPLLAGARNAKIVSAARGDVRCCDGVPMREVPTELDRSKGDIHATGNPHYLVDPENAKIVAHHMADAFSASDEPNRDFYQANAKKFDGELDARLKEWQATLTPFKGQSMVSYHNSWPYFASRFGLKIELFIEPKPGIPPSPSHLAELISKMKAGGVRVILVDPYVNRKSAEMVARGAGATVVDVAQFPGAIKGTEGSYIALMDHMVKSIADALKGQADGVKK
jgi:zinc/manganese transport system substrate-binding protein